MEITRTQLGDAVELKIKGRLDSYWCDDLARMLGEIVREGVHHIRLDLAETVFLSSAGIRVLMTYFKQLKGLQGSFGVQNLSEGVAKVLELSGLKNLLTSPGQAPAAPPVHVHRAERPQLPIRQIERNQAAYEVYDHPATPHLQAQLLGDPRLFARLGYRQEHCRSMKFPETTFALGLGALGNDFNDCKDQFGEFMSAAGAVAHQPTGTNNVADYLIMRGASVPDVQVSYGIACTGGFAHFLRFQTKADAGSLGLTELLKAFLDIADSPRIGLVLVAESAGLIGAALRRSPVAVATPGDPFAHPGIRDWLTFSAEHTFRHSQTLVVGVATRGDPGALAPIVRPLGRDQTLQAHCHAAPFSYRPLPRGEIDYRTTITSLFENQSLEAVLHLLTDDRAIAGAGESEFVRGVCWLGRIGDVVVERT